MSKKVKEMARLLNDGEFEEAMALADKITDPEKKKAAAEVVNNFAALLAFESRYYDDAETLLKKALELCPEMPETHYNLGMLYTEPEVLLQDESRLQDAELHYRKAIELRPDYGEARHNIGLLYYYTGRTKDAMREYLKATDADPEDRRFNVLGRLLVKKLSRDKEKDAGEKKDDGVAP